MVKNRLKEILKDRGIKQTWLAEQVGITATTMGNIVHNRYNTSLEVALKLSLLLNLNVENIFYISDTK